MARALKRLGAENTVIFVDKAAGAGSRNVAFYHRRRAQILAARSNELGGLVSFISVGGQPVNTDAKRDDRRGLYVRRHCLDRHPAKDVCGGDRANSSNPPRLDAGACGNRHDHAAG